MFYLNKIIIVTVIGVCFYLIIISGCTTQEGIISSLELTGAANVAEINNLDAEIFVNFKNTGKTTANGIIKDLPIGEHRIHIHLDRYICLPEYVIVNIKEKSLQNVRFELKPVSYGELVVTTSPVSALVLVDSVEFGSTPLNLNGINTGEHTISFYGGNYTAADTILRIKKYQKTTVHKNLSLHQSVVIEHFSNTSCLGCPEISSLILKSIEHRNDNYFFDIEYHPPVPSPEDIMYQVNSVHNDIVFNFYNPQYVPFVYVNGKAISRIEPDEIKTDLITLLDENIKREPEYALGIQKGFSDSGEVYVHAVKNDIFGLFLKVHLIQSEIKFDNPQGSNGEKEFFNIYSGSAPSPDGIKITLPQGQSKKIPVYFNSRLYPDKTLHVIAYLQDKTTKEIKQSTKLLWKL